MLPDRGAVQRHNLMTPRAPGGCNRLLGGAPFPARAGSRAPARPAPAHRVALDLMPVAIPTGLARGPGHACPPHAALSNAQGRGAPSQTCSGNHQLLCSSVPPPNA